MPRYKFNEIKPVDKFTLTAWKHMPRYKFNELKSVDKFTLSSEVALLHRVATKTSCKNKAQLAINLNITRAKNYTKGITGKGPR